MNWGNVEFNSLMNDKNIQTMVGKQIENDSWLASPFAPMVGKSGFRGIRHYSVPNDQPYRARLKDSLTGKGVHGNTDFKKNYDEMGILTQTLHPRVIANSIKSEIEQYTTMKNIDFVKEATDSLTRWITNVRDRELVCALSNDFTNVVVAKAISETDPLGYQAYESGDSIQTMTRKITKGDVCNVAFLSRAVFMARNGVRYDGEKAFPMKPIQSDVVTTKGVSHRHDSFIILLDGWQAEQLRRDPAWIKLQSQAHIRGDENNIFKGLLGMIQGCPVIDMGIWSDQQVGMLNSSVSDEDFKANINSGNCKDIVPPSKYTGDQAVSIGAIIGASALLMAGTDHPKFYCKPADLGRKTIVGVDRVLSIAKARFDGKDDSVFAGQDFATIGLFTSCE